MCVEVHSSLVALLQYSPTFIFRHPGRVARATLHGLLSVHSCVHANAHNTTALFSSPRSGGHLYLSFSLSSLRSLSIRCRAGACCLDALLRDCRAFGDRREWCSFGAAVKASKLLRTGLKLTPQQTESLLPPPVPPLVVPTTLLTYNLDLVTITTCCVFKKSLTAFTTDLRRSRRM